MMTDTIDVNPNATGLLEDGAPGSDSRAFRRALSQFATGVTVIATSTEGEPVGLAANSFSAVSLDPPLVLWSLRKESKRVPAFLAGGHFTISVLAHDQMDVAGVFGRPHANQFLDVDWSPGRHGDPLIGGAIAHFECTTEDVLDGGDHHIFIGRVDWFARYEGEPLLFTQGQYAVSESHPNLDAGGEPAEAVPVEHDDLEFMSLLRATDHHMSALFEIHRRALGVTNATARILRRLSLGPRDFEVLEQETFLGENAAQDSLSQLTARGYVGQEPNGAWALTAQGRDLYIRLRHSVEQYTARQLEGISADDLVATERVLRTLLSREASPVL